MIPFEKIAIVGSGNVAFAYAKVLKNNGINVYRMLVRNPDVISEIKTKFDVVATLNYHEIVDCDIVIIAVNDDAIEDVASKLKSSNAMVVHTSGMKPSNILNKFLHHGVIYPLQTITKDYDIDFKDVPFIITASSPNDVEKLMALASVMSELVVESSDENRAYVHMNAIYVSNFVNVMLQIANKLLDRKNLDISIFRSLVNETIKKSFSLGPKEALTGPAKRRDMKTINAHKQMLENDIEEKKIYEILTDYILNKYK